MAEATSDGSALLARAEQAHRSGHFAQVRALLAQLARGQTLTAEEKQRALALRARLRPDPLVTALIVTCLILFVLVVTSTWR